MRAAWRLLAVLIAALWIVGYLPSGPAEASGERVSRDDLVDVSLVRRADDPVVKVLGTGSAGEAAVSVSGASFQACEAWAGRGRSPRIARIVGAVWPRGPPAIA